ncbi:MAG: hypothetical protein H8E68_08440 [Kiritimatiellaeota bacterium]|nr:hypothetical protein [Kiritimatiellota bacterium]
MGFKQTVCFIVIGVLLISSAVFAAEPKISLSAENQPLGEVLKNLEEQSGLEIVLKDKKWATEPVSFSVRNVDAEKVLDAALGQYDYALEWNAENGQLTKVLVTVHERKSVAVLQHAGQLDDVDNKQQRPSRELLVAMDEVAMAENIKDSKSRLMEGLGLTEQQYQKMVVEN